MATSRKLAIGIPFLMMVLYMLTGFSGRQAAVQGKWASDTDPKSLVIITANSYIEIYKLDTVYSGLYQRTNSSCDELYLDNNTVNNADFISLQDGRCFEITGLTAQKLTLRYTTSGKLIAFHRVKK